MTRKQRTTKETRVEVVLARDGGAIDVKTPDPFLTHMLTTLARYAGWGLTVKAESRDEIDHHVVEDAAITLGQAVRDLIAKAPVARFGHAAVPMDDALVEAVLDAGGRAYYDGELPLPMMEHVLRSFAFEAGLTLHIDVRRGREAHHVTEAAFKALGLALGQALRPAGQVRSTKGEIAYGG